jgi:glycosyltransferase involved in cell wall biosynthesis
MRILFLHSNFPAQFRHLAVALAQDPQHQVVFGTKRAQGRLPRVHKVLYATATAASQIPHGSPHPQTHPYLRSMESAVLEGQAVYRMGQALKAQGFVPDVVYGHSGWGNTLFIKDVFPQAKLLNYFEWFYHAHGSDADFDPNSQLDANAEARIRMRNAPILMDLANCDRALTPTSWQQQQFPPEYQSKLKVLHDGVDPRYFAPNPDAKLVLPAIGLDLSHVEQIVTYTTRGMEPYRGFPQFMEAVALIQRQHPKCHVVIAGDDRAYGQPLPDGKTYKQLMLEKLPLDLSRIHFTGSLPYDQYLQVLQASSAHIYLTYPFVLSWSMLEAMSTGCVVIGSRTAPVQEVIKDGTNGLLVDFFSPEQIAEQVTEVLDYPDRFSSIRHHARETILKHYDLRILLPQHIQWMQQRVRSFTTTRRERLTSPISQTKNNSKLLQF